MLCLSVHETLKGSGSGKGDYQRRYEIYGLIGEGFCRWDGAVISHVSSWLNGVVLGVGDVVRFVEYSERTRDAAC